jgi:hypothetical protein
MHIGLFVTLWVGQIFMKSTEEEDRKCFGLEKLVAAGSHFSRTRLHQSGETSTQNQNLDDHTSATSVTNQTPGTISLSQVEEAEYWTRHSHDRLWNAENPEIGHRGDRSAGDGLTNYFNVQVR